MLRTMGGERERRLREREATAPATAQTPPPPPSAPSKPALGKLSAAAKRASRQAA
jgi:hypothetical protein